MSHRATIAAGMARIPGLVLAEFTTSRGHRNVVFEGDDGKLWIAPWASLRGADEKSAHVKPPQGRPPNRRW